MAKRIPVVDDVQLRLTLDLLWALLQMKPFTHKDSCEADSELSVQNLIFVSCLLAKAIEFNARVRVTVR